MLSHIRLLATPWTAVCQAPLSLGFSRQEYWGGVPFPPPGNLPNPGIEPESLTSTALPGDSLPLMLPGMPYFNSRSTIKMSAHKFWLLPTSGRDLAGRFQKS